MWGLFLTRILQCLMGVPCRTAHLYSEHKPLVITSWFPEVILCRLSLPVPWFRTQSTPPLQRGGALSVTLRLLVTVPSGFLLVLVSVWFSTAAFGGSSQWMEGAGFPVAEQLKACSSSPRSSSCCRSAALVFTEETPSGKNKNHSDHFLCIHSRMEVPPAARQDGTASF